MLTICVVQDGSERSSLLAELGDRLDPFNLQLRPSLLEESGDPTGSGSDIENTLGSHDMQKGRDVLKRDIVLITWLYMHRFILCGGFRIVVPLLLSHVTNPKPCRRTSQQCSVSRRYAHQIGHLRRAAESTLVCLKSPI
jgi:hypothetical protein